MDSGCAGGLLLLIISLSLSFICMHMHACMHVCIVCAFVKCLFYLYRVDRKTGCEPLEIEFLSGFRVLLELLTFLPDCFAGVLISDCKIGKT